MFVLMSHPIDTDSPGWPGNPKYSYKKFTALEKGEMCNTFTFELFNHYGTHFDAPYHFDKKGPKISDLPIGYFIFDKPIMVDIPKTYWEIIEPKDFEPFHDRI